MTTHIVGRTTEFSSEQLMHTIPEAAQILRVGRTTVYTLMSSGALRPVHIGRAVRISRGELERYVTRLDDQAGLQAVDNPDSPSPAA